MVDKDQLRDMVRSQPEYVEGRLADAQVEQVVEDLYARQDEVLKEALAAQINRELLRMAARGEVYWDPKRAAWRMKRS